MKLYKYCMICLVSALLFGCSDDENKSHFDNTAFINSNRSTTTLLVSGDTQDQVARLNVAVAKPIEDELNFTFEIDPSLVSFYNLAFYDNAKLLPAENYEALELKAIVKSKAVRSSDIQISFKGLAQMEMEGSYVLPVTISKADNMDVLPTRRTHFYVFRQGALVNWAADTEQNYFPVNWGTTIPASMNEVTFEGLLYIRELERPGSDSNIMTFMGCETASSAFLVRLGDTFNPGQIMVCAKNSRDKYPQNANDRTTVPLNRWFHLAVTINANNQLKIYLDGELKSISTTASGPFNIRSNFYIGFSWNSNRWWPGQMCEIRVWDYARSQEDIAANMYRVKPNSEGLLGYWKFNEGAGNDVKDYSGKNNDITSKLPLTWQSISLPEK